MSKLMQRLPANKAEELKAVAHINAVEAAFEKAEAKATILASKCTGKGLKKSRFYDGFEWNPDNLLDTEEDLRILQEMAIRIDAMEKAYGTTWKELLERLAKTYPLANAPKTAQPAAQAATARP